MAKLPTNTYVTYSAIGRGEELSSVRRRRWQPEPELVAGPAWLASPLDPDPYKLDCFQFLDRLIANLMAREGYESLQPFRQLAPLAPPEREGLSFVRLTDPVEVLYSA